MVYYIPVEFDEHFLNRKEIAQLYGLYSITDNPYVKLIDALFLESNEVVSYFYPTAKGIMKVYPKNFYEPIINNLLLRINNKEGIHEVEIKVNDKNKKFILNKKGR